MTKRLKYLPDNPITLVCPLCKAKPNVDCENPSGDHLPLVHVVRIKAAAKLDVIAKKARRKIRKPSRKAR